MKNVLKVSAHTHALVRGYIDEMGLNRQTKKYLRSIFNQGEPEDKYISMLEGVRCCYEDEACTEYGILDPKDFDGGMNELLEWLEEQKVLKTSPYDCTGQFYTAYQLVHVNPTGLVSFVHHLTLDV